MDALDWMVTETVRTPEAINISGGWGFSPEYANEEAFIDSIIDTFDIVFVKSAGNEGPGESTLTVPGTAYNIISAANMYDWDTIPRDDDIITPSSSRGPTVAGRKKPEIAAPGTDSMSTHIGGGFSNIGGTSSAAPHITGGAILLRNAGIVTSYGIRAVLINSCDTWSDNDTLNVYTDDGPLPFARRWDRTYGFGYLNLGKAYVQAPHTIETSMPRPLLNSRAHYYVGHRSAFSKYTLVWNRHVSTYSGAPPGTHYSLSNLNLAIYNRTSGNLIDSSTSSLDSVEQVYSGSQGPGVLKVYTTGSFSAAVDNEGYALGLPTTFTRINPPSLSVAFSLPEYAVPGQSMFITAQVTNNGELPARDVIASINTQTAFPNHNQQLGVIEPGQTTEVVWEVELNQTVGVQSIQVSASSTSWGSTFTGNGFGQIRLLPSVLPPSEMQTIRGVITAGNLASVFTSDNQRLEYRPGIVFSTAQWPVEVVFRATAPIANPSVLVARVESNGSSASLRQSVQAYNYNSLTWVEIDNQNLTVTDRTLLITIPHTPGPPFVHPSTRQVQLKVLAKPFAPVFSFPWAYRIDQLGWHVVP